MSNDRLVAWKHVRPGCGALTLRPAEQRGGDKPPAVCDGCRQRGEFVLRELDRRPHGRRL